MTFKVKILANYDLNKYIPLSFSLWGALNLLAEEPKMCDVAPRNVNTPYNYSGVMLWYELHFRDGVIVLQDNEMITRKGASTLLIKAFLHWLFFSCVKERGKLSENF